MKWIGSGRESCTTSFPFLLKEISYHYLIGRAGNLSALSVLVPEIDFFKVELIEIGIVLKSLVDCWGFADTFKSLVSLISLSDAQISLLFRVKSVLGGASFEELLLSLSWNVPEMLEESIWDWFTISVSRNSICEKSEGGTEPGTEPKTEGALFGCFGCSISWISSPLSEIRIASFLGNYLQNIHASYLGCWWKGVDLWKSSLIEEVCI